MVRKNKVNPYLEKCWMKKNQGKGKKQDSRELKDDGYI